MTLLPFLSENTGVYPDFLAEAVSKEEDILLELIL